MLDMFNSFFLSRNTDSASIEAKQRQYIQENQSAFISLIETAKLRTGSSYILENFFILNFFFYHEILR